MAADPDQNACLLAEYQAVMELERAEWKVFRDTDADPAQRLAAYARWREAAERTKTLAIRIREEVQGRSSAQPSPPPTPLPQ